MDMIDDAEELRAAYGAPSERAVKKQLSRLDKDCRDFIARSPFVVIASADPAGRCDASPKGDAPGFVRVIDDATLLIPDRLGNNRVDTLGNLVARPGIGLIFFVPGINETLRVNGRAHITVDPALLEPLAVNGKVPRSGILVSAEEVYFHCGKALIRSDLWNPEKHSRRSAFPSLTNVLTEQIGGEVGGDPERVERYKTRLY
jgi:PPOX class probable FMN-dependent enzyme